MYIWWKKLYTHHVPKLAASPTSNSPNSVCSLWILTKYRTLYYLNITYGHTYYDVRSLPCVLNVTSLWRQILFTLRYVQCIVIDKGIKQQRTRLTRVEAKGGHFKLKLKD